MLVNLSGRGDKDVDTAAKWFGVVSDEEIVAAAEASSSSRRRTPPARAGEPASRDVLAAARAEGPRRARSATCRPATRRVDGAAAAMVAMVEAGVDIVEIGLPYSDPLMDGPTIQAAVEVALAAATRRPTTCSRSVRAVAATGAPALVMTYWNPIERRGVGAFAGELAAAGGAGVITPDLTPDEAGEWLAASDETGLDRIFLVAPSSTDERLRYTAEHCRGFVYAASTMGVTGTRDHGRRRGRDAGRPHPRGHRPAGLRRARRLAPATRRPRSRLRRRRHRRVGLRPRALLDAPSAAAGSAAVADLAAELADGVRRAPSARLTTVRRARVGVPARPCPTNLSSDEPRLHPQPLAGRLAPRPVADPRLRLLHHRRRRARRLGRREALGRARRPAR